MKTHAKPSRTRGMNTASYSGKAGSPATSDRGRYGTPNRAPREAENRPAQRQYEGASQPSSGSNTARTPLLPTEFACAAMDALPQVIESIMPLKRNHMADLPHAVRDLSTLLTSERSGLARSYWSSPRFVSAYLRYFLPWNLIRLTRLLHRLDLPDLAALPTDNPPLVVDLGSGPLSFPIALWLAKPEWRERPIQLVCVDTAPRPMELGRVILENLATALKQPFHWRIKLVRAPFARALRDVHNPVLLTAGNVLNEWQGQKQNDETATLADRLTELAFAVRRLLPAYGAALFVEPGTRLGGTLTATLREGALDEGLVPVSPCTHQNECPLLGRRDRGWCHSNEDIDPAAVPARLAGLSRLAHLPKRSLSLSHLLVRPEESVRIPAPDPSGLVHARILSDAFLVPGMGHARYACTEYGLAILPRAGAYASGDEVLCSIPEPARRDPKSDALEMVIEKLLA